MKTSHKLLITLGVIALPFCVFFLPGYNAAQQAADAFGKGKSALSSGDFTTGMPFMRYALEQVRMARGSLDSGTISTARAIALDASTSYPSDSPEALKLLHDYSIPLTCEQKKEVFTELIKTASAYASSEKTIPSMGKPLYAAMLWSQDCEPAGRVAEVYNKLLEIFLHGMGKKYTDDSPFVSERWGNGYTSENHRVPIVSEEQFNKAPSPVEQAKELAASMKHSLGRVLGSASPGGVAMPPPPTPAPAPAPAVTVTPAPPATSTQPAPATPAPAPPQPEAKKEVAEPEPKPEQKAEKQPQQEVVTKQQLEIKNKPEVKKEVKKPAAAPVTTPASPEQEILQELASRGVAVKKAKFSKDRKSIEVTFISGATGNELRKELRALYTVIYQKAVTEAKGKKISKIIINCNDKDNYMRHQLNTSVSDYEKYLDNKISGKQLLERGSVLYSN